MPTFIPALDLAESYYRELIRPLLDEYFPGLPHSAALIGYGSEVLGFDTPMSMDHCWAPRMQLFLPESVDEMADGIDQLLRQKLRSSYRGFSLGTKPSLDEPGTFFMDEKSVEGQVAHAVQISSLKSFILEEMNWDLDTPLDAADWLTFPSQLLRVITSGRVFEDTTGELERLRRKLAWYPQDAWIYLLAAGWDRISQEDALMQRAGYVGDELGSALMGSRLARDIMSLCFLMEKTYAPYPKWFGSGFKQLTCADNFLPVLWRIQTAETWETRAAALGDACVLLAKMHNRLGLTTPVPEETSAFHDRPFQVIHAEEISKALLLSINDLVCKRIAEKGALGGLDQISDNTLLRSNPSYRPQIKKLYESG